MNQACLGSKMDFPDLLQQFGVEGQKSPASQNSEGELGEHIFLFLYFCILGSLH